MIIYGKLHSEKHGVKVLIKGRAHRAELIVKHTNTVIFADVIIVDHLPYCICFIYFFKHCTILLARKIKDAFFLLHFLHQDPLTQCFLRYIEKT